MHFKNTLLLAVLILTSLSIEAETVEDQSIRVDKKQRTYDLFIPPPQEDSEDGAPLFVFLHGGLGNSDKIRQQTQIEEDLRKVNSFGLFPDSFEREQWNDGRHETENGVDDVKFIMMAIQKVIRLYSINPDKIFLAGISNGGMMAMRVLCEGRSIFSGAAVVAASRPRDYPHCVGKKLPEKLLFFHGTRDRIVPCTGGQIASGIRRGASGHVVGIEQTFNEFIAEFTCATRLDRTTINPDPRDRTKVQLLEGRNCQNEDQTIAFYKIHNGGHNWPGMDPSNANFMSGRITQDISASKVIIESFLE